MSVTKQIVLAGALLLALATGALWHFRSEPESGAEAAVGRGLSAIPVRLGRAEAGTVRERIEAVGSTLARQAIDIVDPHRYYRDVQP